MVTSPIPNAEFSENGLLQLLIQALRELPNANAQAHDAKLGHNAGQHDAEIELSISGHPVRLLVEVKKAAFPRDVRQLLWQIRQPNSLQVSGDPREETVPLLAAESISTGARQLLREQGVGYFDTGGSLFVPARGAYVFIDKPVPRALAKSVRSFFMGRRSQVLHAMLRSPHTWFGVKELAQRALVSPATASETLAAMERFDWVTSRGQGPAKERCLTEPGALLDAWARQTETARAPAMRRYFLPAANAETLVDRVAAACKASHAEYALTHEAAAQRYAAYISHVSQVRCRLLSGSPADAAIAALNARTANEGANFVVLEAKSLGEFLFRESVDNVWLASPIQVYLDLLSGEGRGKEMAEHLRREKIGF